VPGGSRSLYHGWNVISNSTTGDNTGNVVL